MMPNPVSPHIQLKSRLLPVLTATVLVLQLIDPYKGWMLLLVGLGLTWLLSFLWVRSLARNINLVREMRFGWAQVGDQLEERFTLVNGGWFPALWIEVLDRSDMPGYKVSRATGVDGNSHNAWHTSGLCTRRGLFRLGPTDLLTGDPFGIYTASLPRSGLDYADGDAAHYPPAIHRRGPWRPHGRSAPAQRRARTDGQRAAVCASGPLATACAGSTGVRLPGATSPMCRVFDGTPAGDWWILLDMDRRVQAGQGWDSTTEYSIILAASLADRGLRMKRAVGLVSNGKELVWHQPEEGKDQRWEILRSLALIDPGDYTLAELLERVVPAIGLHTSLVIITPNTQPDWIKPLLHLIWRGAVPTVLLLDPATFETTADSRQQTAENQPPKVEPEASRPQAAVMMDMLAELGVSRHLIGRDLIDRPEARPGQEGQWEWKVMPTGHAIPVRRPTNINWKVLS